jgi:predicted metal-dependent HD superfamily phosphohydrolase
MKELLDRLKQIDPTTYKRYNTDKIICDMDLAIAVKNAWLQACLQTAIRSRGGWYWEMSSQQLDGTGKYVCEIVKESGWKTVWVREEGNSPADAMLAAYIEAMA